MRAVLLFPLELVKFLLVGGLVAGAIWYFHPTAGLIAGGLAALGSIGAAAEESRKKAQASRDRSEAKRMQHELSGFSEAARTTSRRLS